MSYQFLTVDRRGPVEYVTLNRPDVRNAFNEHVIAELTAWARAAHRDASLRVVVIAGIPFGRAEKTNTIRIFRVE